MIWILFVITIISCAYSLFCLRLCRVYKDGFVLITKMAYNPQNEKDVQRIIIKMEDELNRTKETNNG